MELSGFWLVFWFVIVFILGGVAGLFLSRLTIKSYFKKNPPITEEMIATMMTSMGQTPNRKKIKQIMKKMNNQ
ncbi:MAG: YneF family protein [Mycoplasmatales bacterium]